MQEAAWSNLPGRVMETPRPFVAALVAGQLGGLAFLVVWCFSIFVFHRELPWAWPIQVIGSFLLGEKALFQPDALTYVLGVLMNQVVALVWSGAFGWLVISPRFSSRLATSVSAGLLLGLIAISVNVYLLVPPIFGVLHDQDYWWAYLPRTWDWIAHIAFGMVTGWFFEVFRPTRRPTRTRG